MMRRLRRNDSTSPFTADCGHVVNVLHDFFEVSDGNVMGATIKDACSPACADRVEAMMAEPEHCRWRGCPNEGTPRNIHVTLPAPKLGGGTSVLVTFSDDVPLCDAHEEETRAMIEAMVQEEMQPEEETHGQDADR